jgi:CheY-like chemotaxis protein
MLMLLRGAVVLKQILLVEDSKFLRISVERALARAGFGVASAADGEQAVQMALAQTPDLILLDMLLPKLGGPQVLRALRKNPTTASVPVVVLSSLAQKNEMRLVRDGASAYFEKSKLGLDRGWEALMDIVKKMLNPAELLQRSLPPQVRPSKGKQ